MHACTDEHRTHRVRHELHLPVVSIDVFCVGQLCQDSRACTHAVGGQSVALTNQGVKQCALWMCICSMNAYGCECEWVQESGWGGKAMRRLCQEHSCWWWIGDRNTVAYLGACCGIHACVCVKTCVHEVVCTSLSWIWCKSQQVSGGVIKV